MSNKEYVCKFVQRACRIDLLFNNCCNVNIDIHAKVSCLKVHLGL